jgi:AcrR family transcriptional regulator
MLQDGKRADRKAHTREAILDAAYSLIARLGVQRTTFEDIASKAGVSRQTLYRHFDGKDDLVAGVMDREADRFFHALSRLSPEGVSLDEALTAGLTFTFDYLANHPLLSWVHEHEPDELLIHLRSHWAPILDAVRRFVEPFVAAEVAAGRISPARAQLAGDWISRIAISYLIVPGDSVDLRDEASIRALIPSLMLDGLRANP